MAGLPPKFQNNSIGVCRTDSYAKSFSTTDPSGHTQTHTEMNAVSYSFNVPAPPSFMPGGTFGAAYGGTGAYMPGGTYGATYTTTGTFMPGGTYGTAYGGPGTFMPGKSYEPAYGGPGTNKQGGNNYLKNN